MCMAGTQVWFHPALLNCKPRQPVDLVHVQCLLLAQEGGNLCLLFEAFSSLLVTEGVRFGHKWEMRLP